jgi:hypothetical protein
MNVNQIIKNVESRCSAHIYIDRDPDSEPGWYIEEEQAIGISVNQSDAEAIASIVHEVAHHVDIEEHNHHERRDIDAEVIAHAVEYAIIDKEPINGIIPRIEDSIREGYCINEHAIVDEDDIRQVAERVQIICGVF